MLGRNPPGLDFWGHLGALRTHLIAAAVCYGVALVTVLIVLRPLISVLTAPLASLPLVLLTPLGPFAFQMRVATLGAFILSLGPWALLLVHFAAPALSPPTRRWSWASAIVATALGLIALVATDLWVMPWSLRVLAAAPLPGFQVLLTADSYLDLFVLEALFTALLLQLPLLLVLLSLWGLIDPRRLGGRRDIVYLILVIAVAVITPTTDIPSLLLAMIPATLSLESGLLAASFIHTRRQRSSAAGDTIKR